MKITKSFQYDDQEEPRIHAWIIGLGKEGKTFSEAVRRLISAYGGISDDPKRTLPPDSCQNNSIGGDPLINSQKKPKIPPYPIDDTAEFRPSSTAINKHFFGEE